MPPWSPLVQAGDLKGLQALHASEPAALHHRDDRGNTPLHWAVERGQPDVVAWLLSIDVDADALNQDGRRALHNAFEFHHNEIAKQLIDAGAFVDAPYAAATDDVVRLIRLLDEEPDRLTDFSTGLSLLEWAAYGDAPQTMALLLGRGLSANTAHPDGGFTALMPAAQCNNCLAAKVLLEAGAKPNVTDTRGCTPLHYATAMQYNDDGTAIATMLLDYGADVNARANDGNTPLGLVQRLKRRHEAVPDSQPKAFDAMIALLEGRDGIL